MLLKIQKVFENKDVLVINKPAMMHSASGKDSNSIFNYLQQFYSANFNFCQEGGLLQRLDYQTSGLVMIAKSKKSLTLLKQAIKDHKIVKTYLFISNQNSIKNDLIISGYLSSRYRGSQKMTFSTSPQKRSLFAETKFKFLQDFSEGLFLYQAETNYGRRHQVRLIAAEAGIPLLGDSLYQKTSEISSFQDYNLNNFPDFFLHAKYTYIPSVCYNKDLKMIFQSGDHFTNQNNFGKLSSVKNELLLEASNPSYLEKLL